MKTRFFLILIFLTGFFSFSSGQDFWEEVVLPDLVVPNKIDFDLEGNIYLLTLNGVYRSNDNGQTWENLSLSFIESYNVGIEATENNSIYVGSVPYGKFYYSSDGGESWDSTQTNIEGTILLKSLRNTSDLYIGNFGGIYKSVNNGNNWTKVLNATIVEAFYDIIETDGGLIAGSVHWMSSDSGGVYQSLNGGNTWNLLSLTGHGIYSFDIDTSNNIIVGVFVAPFQSEPGIYKSTDSGHSWVNIYNEAYIGPVLCDPFGGIYGGLTATAGNSGWGIRYSHNNGLTWDTINSGMEYCEGILELKMSPDSYIYAITQSTEKLYRSYNPIVEINGHSKSKPKCFKVFPNPSSNKIFINSPLFLTYSPEIVIYSMINNIFHYYEENINYNSKTIEIDISKLPSGTHIMLIKLNNETFHIKFFKI